MTPTARTLNALREAGHEADVVERWMFINGKPLVRKDLFGMFDVLALRGGRVVGIQCTDGGEGGHHANRRAKLLGNELLPKWLECADAEVWSWHKYAEAVKRRKWRPRVEAIVL